MDSRPTITLTTDFGHSDGFVGTLKGVILSINPNVEIVDITHDIPSYDISSAAWVLSQSVKYFSHGCIHLAVIDPTVGSTRKKILLKGEKHIFIGPDNGLFTPFIKDGNVIAFELTSEKYWLQPISQTFQARDVFAPIAAHTSLGISPFELGKHLPLNELVKLDIPELTKNDNAIQGAVVYIDKFGNLISNIPQSLVQDRSICSINNHKISISNSYSSVNKGELIALIGSHGYLEIAVYEGSAKNVLQAKTGQSISVSPN